MCAHLQRHLFCVNSFAMKCQTYFIRFLFAYDIYIHNTHSVRTRATGNAFNIIFQTIKTSFVCIYLPLSRVWSIGLYFLRVVSRNFITIYHRKIDWQLYFHTGVAQTHTYVQHFDCVEPTKKKYREFQNNRDWRNNKSKTKMSHTILLVQPGSRPETRTYSDYESVNECMEGVCKIYEEHLKRRNPNTPTITYDISQLFDFLDQVINWFDWFDLV